MRKLATGILFALLAYPAALPQTAGQSQEPVSLGDAARKQRELKEQQARTAGNPTSSTPQSGQGIADVAREQQEKSLHQVRTSLQDSQKLFASINEVLEFAMHDSGYTKRTPIKHQLMGETEVKRQMLEEFSKSVEAQRLARSELVWKKFGFLPNNFDLKAFLDSASLKGLGAFYDPRTKTVNLLNWIEISEQLPILSHELTHALQDQNYDLMKWRGIDEQRLRQPSMRMASEEEEDGTARTAVVEGQAEIVHYDYMLKPYEKSLVDTPQFMDLLEDALNRTSSYNTVVVHNEPLLLKETGIFPYREGLNFELELLRAGGRGMAFAGAFARPPHDTHEILQPQAYLSNQKKTANLMPDLTSLLAGQYEPYDSGLVGELDVRTMAKQFGRDEDGINLASNWLGGAYVAVKRISAPAEKPKEAAAGNLTPVSADKPATDKPGQATIDASASSAQAISTKPTPAAAPAKPAPATMHDLALLYVSRWKTLDAAQRFLEIYQNSLPKRVTVMSTKTSTPSNCATDSAPGCGPVWAVRIMTDDGPIFLEIWPKNLVFISHSFDDVTVNRLRQAVLVYTPGTKPTTSTAELSLRLLALPEFQAYREEMGREIESEMLQQLAGDLKH
jgi:hypothetical protein